jgi:hypothetical protein
VVKDVLTVGDLRLLLADLPSDGEVWWWSGRGLSSPAFDACLLNARRDANDEYLSCDVVLGDEDFWADD